MKNMAYKYKFSSIAKNDLNKALNYISNDLCNKNASNRLLYEIYDIIDKICLFPLSFPNCSYYYVKDETIRYAIINNYYLKFD